MEEFTAEMRQELNRRSSLGSPGRGSQAARSLA